MTKIYFEYRPLNEKQKEGLARICESLFVASFITFSASVAGYSPLKSLADGAIVYFGGALLFYISLRLRR